MIGMTIIVAAIIADALTLQAAKRGLGGAAQAHFQLTVRDDGQGDTGASD
jgi:hypothetical protein